MDLKLEQDSSPGGEMRRLQSNLSSHIVGGGRRGPRWKLFRFPLFYVLIYLALLSDGLLNARMFVQGNSDIESCMQLTHPPGHANSDSNSNVGSDHTTILCKIRTLHPDLDIENLTSSIPNVVSGGVVDVMSITKLKLVCNDVLFFESAVNPGQLSFLSDSLHELTIEKCKLKVLPPGFLSGPLRRLKINTGNSDWAARSLEVSAGALSNLPNLRYLHLGFNHMWNLPDNVLCQAKSLQNLNLTHNLLTDIDDLGLPSALPDSSTSRRFQSSTPPSSAESCLGDLKILDLSFNTFRTLGSRRFEKMKKLQDFHVNHNWISELEDDVFVGLTSLRLLNLSSNRLVALPVKLFEPFKHLKTLDLHNNSLASLSPGILNGLEHLESLDLSRNALTSQYVTSEAFKSLVRLIVLNLSHNQLNNLAISSFRDLFALQVLDLEDNLISSIDDGTFEKMTNLHSLNLGRNRLVNINVNMFNGLYVLRRLILDYNQIETIEVGALRNCTSLEDVGLVGNKLNAVPDAIRGLQFIRTLDLGENRISSLNNESFLGMTQLYGLRIVDNKLEELPKGLCDPLKSLRVLNVAQNRIRKVSSSAFTSCPLLKVLRLDSNALEELPSTLAPQLNNLLWLNVSENQIRWADYSVLPVTLEWLDISHNQLESLTWAKSNNRITGPNKQNVGLRVVEASHNRLTQLNHHTVPANVEILRLNHNRIHEIVHDTFSQSNGLRRVELIGNMLESITLNALRGNYNVTPQFYIGGNPLLCDCSMDFLLNTRLSNSNQYPQIADQDAIICRLNFPKNQMLRLQDLSYKNLLCPYTSTCLQLCECCGFLCDCEMVCPNRCKCFHDTSWGVNNVDCSNTNYTEIPERIPMDATEIYLDGNNIPVLKSHTFIGRKNLKSLFLNSSNIEKLSNKTFNGLQSLRNLHLENNLLKELKGYEFDHLSLLRELYLQDNLIQTISNTTFLSLKSLEILRLDGNRLVKFTVWQLSLNPYLVEIGLARNRYDCSNCKFLHQLYGWVTDNSRKILDLGQLQCVWNTTSSYKPGPHLIDYNRTCGSYYDGSGFDYFTTVSPVPFVVGFVSLVLLLIIVIILVILCRDNARLWIFSHFGLRLCPSDFEDDKLYDAYLIYSQKDEEFVAQRIADELETNDSYRLCLHYRDLISETGDLKEMMMGAVDNSKSVVLILSRNFLQGEWTSGEYRGAFHAVLKKSQKHSNSSSPSFEEGKKVVIVFIDDIPPMEISPDIRSWVRHNRIQCVKWSISSLDQAKHKKFWSKLKYSLPAPSSHYHSNITSNTTTTTTSASSGETGGVGGIMATLKYTSGDGGHNENDQVIVDELSRTMGLNINNKLWPFATNFVALPPKYQIPNSPGSQTYYYQQQPSQSPHHHHYHPPLPLSNPPKSSPPSSQSTDSTTTTNGDETTNTLPSTNGFSLMGKSPVPVPKSLYSSNSHNNHHQNNVNNMMNVNGGGGLYNNSNSIHGSGGGGGESYLSLEGEHVYSTLDPPSPQQGHHHQQQQVNSLKSTNRVLNNIHLPNGYTYQPQLTPQQSQQSQWHPPSQQGHVTPKGTLNFGNSKSYKQKDGNPVQTYLV